MGKNRSGIVFLVLLFAVPLMMLYSGGYEKLHQAAVSRTNALKNVEVVFTEQFPGSAFLRRMQISLKYLSGNKEQNGIFISDDTLMLNVQPKSQATINKNTLAMIDFSQDFQRPSYVMLVPTACAVQQSKVPYAYDALLYNQKQQLIDDVYRRVSGYVTAVDVYPVLRSHQTEYIYYRTENTTTGLGGYYIYTVVAKKLGLKPRGIEQFEVEHLDNNYYGDLYKLSPYREITPDRVSAYSFSKSRYSYMLSHFDQTGSRRYFTLYPKFKAQLGSKMDILLGGMSPIVDVKINNSPYNQKLLIFGDRSVQSYLPFLLVHYGQITVVDTAKITPELLKNINVARYNQVLFAYSADSFVGKDQLSVLSELMPPAPKV
ncbi:DHHW family protein [Oscillospiraceae bacterium PP1C4]